MTDPRAALAEVAQYYRRHPIDEDEAVRILAERGVLLVNREQIASCIRQDCQHFAAAECLAALSGEAGE